MLRRTPLKRSGPIKRKKPRRAPTKVDKELFAAIHAVNNGYWCVVGDSGWSHECKGNTTVSHRPGAGMSLRSAHNRVAAICTAHHLHGPNSIGDMGGNDWQEKYGQHEKYEQLTKKRREITHG